MIPDAQMRKEKMGIQALFYRKSTGIGEKKNWRRGRQVPAADLGTLPCASCLQLVETWVDGDKWIEVGGRLRLRRS